MVLVRVFLGFLRVRDVTLLMKLGKGADGQVSQGRRCEPRRDQRTKRSRGGCRGRCEWLAAVLLCNTMASEGYFSEGGTRKDKSGADATGHVGEEMCSRCVYWADCSVICGQGRQFLTRWDHEGGAVGSGVFCACLVSHP